MPLKKAKGKKKSKKAKVKAKKISKPKKISKGKKVSKAKKINKKNLNGGTAPAGWCQDFPASPGDLCEFTPPANATITGVPGNYWPFCGPNGTNLPSPITFLANTAVYIKSDCPDGAYQFVPAPCPPIGTIHTVTVSG
jgi:hypothetical protein